MKKASVLAFAVLMVMMVSATAFAGSPWIDFDVTIGTPTASGGTTKAVVEGVFTVGYEDSGFAIDLSSENLFVLKPLFDLAASYEGSKDWWKSEFSVGLVGLIGWPTPEIGGITWGWLGTADLGYLLASAQTGSLASYELTFYGGVSFEMNFILAKLFPTGHFGVHWSP